MLPRDSLLKGVEYREEMARIIDLADQALRTWEMAVTDFLSPPVLVEAQERLGRLTELETLNWGGYPQAERQRLAINRADLGLDLAQIPLAYLEIVGNFLFDSASHRDFLGAILGTGIVRDKVGDIILLGERGAQAIVLPEMADFLTLHLVQVRSVPVKTRVIDSSELKIRPPQKKEMTTVEASLRLDAVASAGFGLSRSKMAEAISRGDVRVNWKEITQPSYSLKAGDLVTFRGKGRLEIGDVSITKKDRYRLQLTRYV
ncbi:photosystem II S4 domain protein [Synechocystis sp. LKSZ1]|uniref:photosystem II S4 domain protein n=1 Tax=Synechocystis sp. LKSZ1 TaxID=3144951 RepID=UPI00336C17A6